MKRFRQIGALVLCVTAVSLADKPSHSGSLNVMGAVKNPGIYVIGKNGSTVIGALDAAGGETAKDLKVLVTHKVNEKLTKEISFSSISELRQHPEADIALDAGDLVIAVPATVAP